MCHGANCKFWTRIRTRGLSTHILLSVACRQLSLWDVSVEGPRLNSWGLRIVFMNESHETGPRVALVVAQSEWVVATLRYAHSRRWCSFRRWTELPGAGEWPSALPVWSPFQTKEYIIQRRSVTNMTPFVSKKMSRHCKLYGLSGWELSKRHSEVFISVCSHFVITFFTELLNWMQNAYVPAHLSCFLNE
jgi:hypothetical protein